MLTPAKSLSPVETIVSQEAWILMVATDQMAVMILLSRKLGIPLNELYVEFREIEKLVAEVYTQERIALNSETYPKRPERR